MGSVGEGPLGVVEGEVQGEVSGRVGEELTGFVFWTSIDSGRSSELSLFLLQNSASPLPEVVMSMIKHTISASCGMGSSLQNFSNSALVVCSMTLDPWQMVGAVLRGSPRLA